MTLACILAGTAQCGTLIYCNVVSYFGGFAYYHACAVVNKKSRANFCAIKRCQTRRPSL